MGEPGLVTVFDELARPALPKLVVGQEFTVIMPRQRWLNELRYSAVVIKVGHKYVYLKATSQDHSWMEWTMVIANQKEKKHSYPARFATPEQLAWDEKLTAARETLRVQGIEISRYGDFAARGDAGVILLAALVAKHFPPP